MSPSQQPLIRNAIVIRQTLDWKDCANVARVVYPRFVGVSKFLIFCSWLFFVLQRMYWPQAVKFANLLPVVITLGCVCIFIGLMYGVISWNRLLQIYNKETVFCFDEGGNLYMPQLHEKKIKLSGFYRRTEIGYMLYDFERAIPAIILLRRGFVNDTEFLKLETLLIKYGMGKNHVGQRTGEKNPLYPDLYKQGGQRHPRR